MKINTASVARIYARVNQLLSTKADNTIVSNTEYGAGWADDTAIAPSKAAVYAKIETVGGGEGGGLTQAQILTRTLGC